MNKFLIAVISILLLLAVGCFLSLPVSIFDRDYAERFLTIAEVMGIIMMLLNGTFRNTRYFKVAKAVIAVLILGVLFKILHLAGADELLVLPWLLLPLVYMAHFLAKKTKNHLDILKLLTVFTFYTPVPLIFLNMISDEQGNIMFVIGHVVFWLTFVDFLVMGYKQSLFKG